MTRVTRRLPLVEHERLTLPELTPDFSGIRAPQPLVLCVVFYIKLLVDLSFGHCIDGL
jgi:hypothetical protein